MQNTIYGLEAIIGIIWTLIFYNIAPSRIELFHVTSQSREKCLVSHVGVQIFIISQPKRRVGLTIDTINHSHGFVRSDRLLEALWAR